MRLGVAPKYYQRIERGLQNLTLKTMLRLARELEVPLAALIEPPREMQVRPGRPPRAAAAEPVPIGPPFRLARFSDGASRCVPLLSLRAAAGRAGAPSAVEAAAYVVPQTERRLRRGMFVARASGRSMEPLIPDGAYCLFAATDALEDGAVMLLEHRGLDDPETGGAYSVKRVRVEEIGRQRRLKLMSANPQHAPIEIRLGPERTVQVRPVARLVDVLG